MKKQNGITTINALVLIGLLTLFQITITTIFARASNAAAGKENTMLPLQKSESLDIPPIDIDLPSDYQTASFGLG